MLALAGVELPPDGNVFWKIAFPVTSLTRPEMRFTELLEPDAYGIVDVAALPFMKEGIAFFPLSILAEVLLGLVRGKKYYRFDDTLTSLMTGLVNRMTTILAQAWMAVPYGYIWTHYRLVDTPDTFTTFFIALLGTDLLYYCYHRTTHEMGLLWNSHSVHHSSNEYNLACALRQTMTPFDSVLFYLPMAFLVPPRVKAVHGAFSLLYQYWVHTRHVPKLWWPIEYVLSTPSHHRVHHARNPAYAAGGGRNYGGVFIIWDRMFGTFAEERVGKGYAMPRDASMVRKLEQATGEPFLSDEGISSQVASAGTVEGKAAGGAVRDVEEAEPAVYGLIPPLRSSEAIYAQTYHWYDMCKRMAQAPSIADALVIPTSPVGWYLVPASAKTKEAWERYEKEQSESSGPSSGTKSIPAAGLAVDKPKYGRAWADSGKSRDELKQLWKDIPVPSIGTRYNPILQETAPLGWAVVLHAGLHFGLVTGAFYVSEMSAAMTAGPGRTALLVLFVYTGMFGVGSLLDRQRFAPWYELLRCTVVSLAIVAAFLAFAGEDAGSAVAGAAGGGFEEIQSVLQGAASAVRSHPDGPWGAVTSAVLSMSTSWRVLLGLHLGSALFATSLLPSAVSAAWAREQSRQDGEKKAQQLAKAKKSQGDEKARTGPSKASPRGEAGGESKAQEGLRHRPTATTAPN